MKSMLLVAAGAVAAAAFTAAPVAAQEFGNTHHTRFGHSVTRNASPCSAFTGTMRDGRSGGRLRGSARDQLLCNTDVAMAWYGGEWALYNNRSWEADSYNDWWHDRPDRAYPAWLRRNQDCQRQWFSGDTLRC